MDINWSIIDSKWWGFGVEGCALLYSFAGLAIVCDHHMVPALDTGCQRWNIPGDVAGATFLAFGSAAPEIIINAVATLQAMSSTTDSDTTSLGVSAIIGSGMIAFSLIPACCALFSNTELLLKRRPLLRDELFYGIALAVLVLIIHDGEVHYWEAIILVSTWLIYLFVIVFSRSIRLRYRESVGRSHNIQGSYIQRLVASATYSADNQKRLLASQSSLNTLEGNPILVREIVDDELDSDDGESLLTMHEMEGSDDSSEMELGLLGKVIGLLVTPLKILFYITCPPCEEGDWGERLYAVTFLSSFLWVTVFSFVLSSVIERWVDLSGVPMAFFGLLLVSLGAEIPDTIESVTVARKGFGSMAVSNCQGTQVINIAVGLGLPWLISTLAKGSHITLDRTLVVPAVIQFGVLLVNIMSLNGVAVLSRSKKAVLNKRKAVILIGTYFAAIVGYGTYLKFVGAL